MYCMHEGDSAYMPPKSTIPAVEVGDLGLFQVRVPPLVTWIGRRNQVDSDFDGLAG